MCCGMLKSVKCEPSVRFLVWTAAWTLRTTFIPVIPNLFRDLIKHLRFACKVLKQVQHDDLI